MDIHRERLQTEIKKVQRNFAKKIKNSIVSSKKRVIISILCAVLFSAVWLWFTESMNIERSPWKKYFLIDLFLILGTAIEIRFPVKWKEYAGIIFMFGAAAFCLWEIEFLHDNPLRLMKFLFVFLNYILILTVFFVVQFIFNRFRITMALGLGIFTFYGLLYSFVKEFRGNGLRAADLYAAETAMNVAGGYTLHFTEKRIQVIFLAFTLFLLSLYINYKHKHRDRIKTGVICLCALTAISSKFSDHDFMENNSVKPYLWELGASEKDHGAFLDFAAGLPYLKVEKPDDYSEKKALVMEEERAGKSGEEFIAVSAEIQKKPHIIAIMNESFADFRNLGDIQLDQEILSNWDSLGENVIKGYTSVPIFGGWTANSEFEFLTGFSNAFFPSGIIPFQNYVKKGTPSLNSLLKEQGYTSTFMHPMGANGWNRKSVYENFGFDYTYYIEDMDDAEKLRGMVSDEGNYAKLIEKFQEQKENGPVFLFNVTMQNHGGYGAGGLENPVHILSPQGNYSQAEEYFTLIRESDEALKNLLDYFSQVDDPVVICMFGDHYPKVEEALYTELAKTAQGNEAEKTSLKYQVPFMIYANYDIEEKEYENISLNYLSTLLCETANIPLSDYQNYLKGLYEEYPVVNVYGVKNKAGEWMNWDEAVLTSEIKEYEMVQYRNLFDRHK